MNAGQVWIKLAAHAGLCEPLSVTSESQGLLHLISRTCLEAPLLSDDCACHFPHTLLNPGVCILRDSEQYIIIIILRHRRTARQTLTALLSCSDPFLIVLDTPFKIDFNLH